MTSRDNSLFWSANSAYIGIRNSNYDLDELPITEANKKSNTQTSLKIYEEQWKAYRDITSEMFQTATFRGSSTCRSETGKMFLNYLSTDEEVDINTLFDDTVAEITKYL